MKRKLEREEEHAVVAGVLAGLAKYFDQDPVLFRVIAIAFLILTGVFPGLLFYLIAWIVMPLRRAATVHADYEVNE